MKKCAFVGHRGMVGQVLWQRMLVENDFAHFSWVLTTSSADKGRPLKDVIKELPSAHFFSDIMVDSYDLETLSKMDIILTCQGSEYSAEVYPKLREKNWSGLWIDAASHFRNGPDSTLLLDPLNLSTIQEALSKEKKLFIGANCTVSLLLLALKGLFDRDLIEWITSMTYQAASGAGASAIDELFGHMHLLGSVEGQKNLTTLQRAEQAKHLALTTPAPAFQTMLAGNVLPWIDSELPSGQSREEAKAEIEASKILGRPVPIDGTCVRVPGVRVHAQALTIQLKKNIPLDDIEKMLAEAHQWIKIIPNHKIDTLKELHPMAVSGTLNIHVGRLRYLHAGHNLLNIFTLGDQLLWGAAEPLRRFLRMLV
jgi:aspartate-semialdehyde dehydrogenase